MKKTGLFFSLILMLLIISLMLVRAQELSGSGLPSDAEQIKNLGEKAMNTSYLKQEWTTMILENKYFGPVFSFIDKVLELINPFFKIVLGVEYSLSWEFIFALAIWLVLFFILYPITKAILNSNTLLSLIATFAIVSLIGLGGVIKKAVDMLSFMINNVQIAWISLAITIIILIIIIIFGKMFSNWIKKEKKLSEKEQESRDKEIQHRSAEADKKNLEGYKDSGSGT